MKVFFYWARLAWFLFLMINIWFFGARALANQPVTVTFDQLFPENSYEQAMSLCSQLYYANTLYNPSNIELRNLSRCIEQLETYINTLVNSDRYHDKQQDYVYLASIIEHINDRYTHMLYTSSCFQDIHQAFTRIKSKLL